MRADLLLEHFDTLVRTPEDVAGLEAAILDLAVQGKLVPQDPQDEPASNLLERAKLGNGNSQQGRQTRKQPTLSPPISNDIPYSLPDGWEWCRLEDLSVQFQNGLSRRRSSDTGKEVIVLRLADIDNGEITPSEPRRFTLTEAEAERYKLEPGDILVTRVNGSIDLVGNFTPVRTDAELAYCDHFIRMRVDNSVAYMPYLVNAGRSELLRSQIRKRFITTAGQKTVNQRHISTLVLPLPPLAEQKRIVAKVEALLALCDALAAEAAAAEETRRRLLAAVLNGG